jgi:uncharacterized protein YbaR (Trm112 family)
MRSSSSANHLAIIDRMDTKLLELLVCPVTKGPLEFDRAQQELVSRSARLAYPVRDGIPVLLENEARTLTDAEIASRPTSAA